MESAVARPLWRDGYSRVYYQSLYGDLIELAWENGWPYNFP